MEVRKMEVRRRQKYVTARQKQKLIELMTKHPELVSCKARQDRQGFTHRDSQRLWQSIAHECNSVHLGARKTWRQWKKTWQDMRSKRKRRQAEANGKLSTASLTSTEQDTLGIKDIESSEFQESTEFQDPTEFKETTEFIPLEETSQEVFNDELSGSLSDRDSPVDTKVFNSSPAKKTKINSPKHSSKHKCYFNCDTIAVQEQRKIQIKEDYLNFKKDYLRQKIKLLKEQTEALKSIAKELST